MNTKEFFDYLSYIGIVSDDNFQILSSIVEKKTKENENNKNIEKNIFMKSLIGEYLASLNKDDLIKLGSHIYDKYINNKLLTISKYLLRLITIKENLSYIQLKTYFIFWKNISFAEKSAKPKIIQRSKSTDKLYRIPNNIQNYNNNCSNVINIKKNYNYFLSPNLCTKLEKYNHKKDTKSINVDDITSNCTFTPNLSLTKKRNNKFRKKNEMNSRHITSSTQGKADEKPKKKVDNDRMNKLYYDFHRKNLNKEKLKKNIDRENGITFAPKLNSQYNKRIKDNFYERNQKLLEDKKDFVNGFNLLRDLQMKGIDINQLSDEV